MKAAAPALARRAVHTLAGGRGAPRCGLPAVSRVASPLPGLHAAAPLTRGQLLRRPASTAPAAPTTSSSFLPHSTTPLAEMLRQMILMRGPLTVADFMRMALGHPLHGYYMNRSHAVFGASGDFVTSPEISQLFGELTAVWLVATWHQLGCPPALALVECGPGRGTLAADIVRVAGRFPGFLEAVAAGSGLHLVETSAALRRAQAAALGVEVTATSEDPTWAQGGAGGGGGVPKALLDEHGRPLRPRVAAPGAASQPQHRVPQGGRLAVASLGGAPPRQLDVTWHERLDTLPPALPVLLVAHELIDALPVHQLVWNASAKAWREVLIDVAPEGDAGAGAGAGERGGLRRVLSPSTTPAAAAFHAWVAGRVRKAAAGAGAAAPSSSSTMPSEAALWAGLPDGYTAEYCPVAASLGHEIGARIAAHGGAALVIDYGATAPLPDAGAAIASAVDEEAESPDEEGEATCSTTAGTGTGAGGAALAGGTHSHLDEQADPEEPSGTVSVSLSVASTATPPSEAARARLLLASGGAPTVRGIRRHAFVDFLTAPGECDVTADVDFTGLAACVQDAEGAAVLGPITQSRYLGALGIGVRVERLLASVTDPAVKARLVSEMERLTDTRAGGMGKLYLAMAVVQAAGVTEGGGRVPAVTPPGFE